MKNKYLSIKVFTVLTFIGMGLLPLVSRAETTFYDTNGKVQVETSDKTTPLDPENPLEPLNPGEGPSTKGDLRIDFVSEVNFADARITKTNRKYPSLAQLFYNEVPARAPYVQITDLRRGAPGWSLQLKQETQFKGNDNNELEGATLSFDKGWANSGGRGKAPTMFRDIISIDQIGSGYQVASASKGAGNGTWLLSFGASESNKQGQDNTLTPVKTPDGQAVIDKEFNKKMYVNTAINLTVPDKTKIEAGRYETKLTWILQATP